MDCSEITKGSVFTKRSTKEKRVSWDKTINCTNKPSEPPDMEEEDDEFEKEMRTVIEERLHKAEVESGIKSKYQTPNTVGKVNSKTDIDDKKMCTTQFTLILMTRMRKITLKPCHQHLIVKLPKIKSIRLFQLKI